MPTTKSAKKRLRQSLARRARNRAVKSTIKTHVRKTREAAAAKDLERGEQEFRVAVKRIDQAAAKGVIHRNAAARLKSRLSEQLKEVKQASAGA